MTVIDANPFKGFTSAGRSEHGPPPEKETSVCHETAGYLSCPSRPDREEPGFLELGLVRISLGLSDFDIGPEQQRHRAVSITHEKQLEGRI
jgi:hypothetical protein